MWIEIADSPEQLKNMGENAAKIAKQEFDMTILAERMLKAIVNIKKKLNESIT